MPRLLAACCVCLVVCLPLPLGAWGLDVHRQTTARALDGLPSPVRAFFAPARAFIVEHSVDPDLWRTMDLRTARGDEGPNHFLNIDALDERAPYTNVPREWDAFVTRYGRNRANRAGRLPWRVAEVYDDLVRFLRQASGSSSGYATDNARYAAAVLAHYVQDAFVPFHAVENYDGQLTDQRGIHTRFETTLVLRYEDRLRLRQVTVRPIADVREFVFRTLVDSAAAADEVLAADRAAKGRPAYDDAYFERFVRSAGPIAARRLSDAADALASLLVRAWSDAGN